MGKRTGEQIEFQNITPVPGSAHLLDAAFSSVREKMEGRTPSKNIWSKDVVRLHGLTDALCGRLGRIAHTFPSTDRLHPFYKELFALTLNMDEFKRALAAPGWAADKIRQLSREYISRMKQQKKAPQLFPLRNEFYGRASSVLRQIDPQLKFLEQCRRILRTYPTVALDCPTVAIAGYPNVGKTSLLKALTGADPEIAPYPFTTRRLMLGYAEIDGKRVQFVDTPGLLDREERNDVETHTVIALRHLASVILFIYDPTESCGYPMARQRSLLVLLKKQFKLPVIIISNKIDILNKADMPNKEDTNNKIERETKGLGISVSAEKGIGISQLQKEIVAHVEKWTPITFDSSQDEQTSEELHQE